MHENADILLISDCVENLYEILQMLDTYWPTLNIKVTGDTAETLRFLFRRHEYTEVSPFKLPRLILLDMALTKRDALVNLRIIKAYSHTQAIPIIVCIGSEKERLTIERYPLRVDNFVLKSENSAKFSADLQRLVFHWLGANHEPSALKIQAESSAAFWLVSLQTEARRRRGIQ